MSPTDFCNYNYVRATKPGLFGSSQGTEASTSFLLLSCQAISLAEALTRGEPHSVRSFQPQCWFLPLAWVCPAVMPPRTPHHQGLLPWCIVRIDVHGLEDRAKDASPSACDDLSCLHRVHTLSMRMPTSFPSSATSGHPLSPARLRVAEDTATRSRTDRGFPSDDAPRRAPPSRRPGCLPPPRHAKDECARRDCSLRPSRRLSRSRRPHFFPN